MSEETYKSSNIKVLSHFEAIRKRPGMYFGDVDHGGANLVIYELVANSIDQFLSGSATCIKISLDNECIIVSDDGNGLPFNKPSQEPDISLAEYYLTQGHQTATADDHAPHVHVAGCRCIGLIAVTAATATLQITSSNGSEVWRQDYREGKALAPPHHEASAQPKGSRFEFTLDKAVFGDAKIDTLLLRKDIFELAHFYPGLRIELGDECFISQHGLLELAYQFYLSRDLFSRIKTFNTQAMQNDIQISIAAIGTTESDTQYISWVNGGRSIKGGSHVNGVASAFEAIDWQPEIVLVNVIMHDPKFAGPTRDFLQDEKVKIAITEVLKKSLPQ